MNHPTVRVSCGDRVADIDEQLAPLILELWKAGINTSHSCQEIRPGISEVVFPTAKDAERFIDLIAVYPREDEIKTIGSRMFVGDIPFWETLYGRIMQLGGEKEWEYEIALNNWNTESEVVDGVFAKAAGATQPRRRDRGEVERGQSCVPGAFVC